MILCRILWLVVLLAAATCLTFLTVTKLMLYYQYNTVIDVQVVSEEKEEFPLVTLCPHNRFW